MKKILNMPQKEAEERGRGRNTFQEIKQRIREEGEINLNTPAVSRLINHLL